MPNEKFTCPRCFKRCGNAGALKTHMKTHKKPEPKSGSLMKWIVKREPVKSESKQKPKEAIELKPIRKTRQLKLRKPIIREPTIVTNPLRPRPPRAPRRSQQPAIDNSPFVAPKRLTDPGLDKRSPQFRIAHVQHFNSLKSDFPVLDKAMYHRVNESCIGVRLRRFQGWFGQQYEDDLEKIKAPKPKKERRQNKVVCQAERMRYTQKQVKREREENEAASSKRIKPNPKPQLRIPKKSAPRAAPNKPKPKKRPRASMDVFVPGPPPGAPVKRFKPNTSKPSSIPSRK